MKWFDTITRHLTPGGTSLLQGVFVLALSLFLSACLIIEIEITEEVDANGVVTLRIVVQEDEADVNAARGVQMLLVPEDWVFVSGTYDASDVNGAVGSGDMVEEASWADSAALGVYAAPDGMKWVGLVSDMAYAHGATLVMETEVEFTAGTTGGTFPIGIVVTKESYHPSNGDWFATPPSTIVGADSAMANYVTVNAGGGGISTIRELITVPEENIQALTAAGASLTLDQMNSLLQDHVDLETEFTIRGVVLTDPLKSGLGTWNDDRGGPSRVHIYVRDPAADDMGNEGMGIQVVDGAYEQNGTLDLIPGDVIEATGRLTPFENSMQFSPTTTIVVLGHYTDLGLSDNILVPDTFSTADINQGFGDGTYQSNWANYNALNGSYVCIDNTTVFRRTVTGSREDWAVTSDGGDTQVTTYDMSLRYRNDRFGSYQPPFDLLDDDFVPPPIGATVLVCGTIVHQGGNDPFGLSIPGDAMLSLVPWNDSDLVVKASPPAVSPPDRPTTFLTSADEFEVVTDVTFDPEREAASVKLIYDAGAGETEMDMTNTEGTTWAGTIPAQAEGAFVTFRVSAEDNTGAVTTSNDVGYRVLDADGLNTIAEIQETADGGPGDSPFRNAEGEMNITATVQSDPAVSGFISIQDDTELAPWSGIIVTASEALVADLATGDEINITAGRIVENFGVTELRDIEYTKTAGKRADQLPYKEVDTSVLADDAGAEAHEGMLVQFNDVVVLGNLSFGEWEYTNGTEDDAVLGDGQSSSFPDDNSLFQSGEKYAYMRGIWWFSFGTYKLVPEDAEDIGELTNVAVEPTGVGVPGSFSLKQNYPNPFNPTTTITFDVAKTGVVRVDVFDLTGRLVSTLVNESLTAGSYQTSFDAGNLPSGMYLYRMTAGGQVMTNKMLLLR